MAAETENQEPSMEEILASIRRIISEDGATVTPAPPADDAPPPPAEEPAAVLELTQEVKEDGSVEDTKIQEPLPVIDLEEMTFDPPPAPVPEPPEPPPKEVVLNLDDDALISETTAQASASVLSSLNKLKSNGSATVTSFPLGDSSRTLEGMVLEIIRPQLKEWLDSNLPTLVEKIVQKEIQKITRNLN